MLRFKLAGKQVKRAGDWAKLLGDVLKIIGLNVRYLVSIKTEGIFGIEHERSQSKTTEYQPGQAVRRVGFRIYRLPIDPHYRNNRHLTQLQCIANIFAFAKSLKVQVSRNFFQGGSLTKPINIKIYDG